MKGMITGGVVLPGMRSTAMVATCSACASQPVVSTVGSVRPVTSLTVVMRHAMCGMAMDSTVVNTTGSM